MTASNPEEVLRAALEEIATAYDKWRPDAEFPSNALFKVSAIARTALAATSVKVQPVDGVEARLTYDGMRSGGRCDWQELREAVAEANMGYRHCAERAREDIYPGHVMVTGINYNSLDRIVTAFVDAALSRHSAPLVKEPKT